MAAFATYRWKGVIRDLGKALGLPAGEIERVARSADVYGDVDDFRRGVAEAIGARRARLGALARADRAGPGGLRPAAPRLPAPRRDGDLDHAADRPVPGAALRDGGPQPRAVGQGLVRGRRLPEDRPAGIGDAVGGRALRGRDRARARRADRPLAHRLQRRRGLRDDPEGRDDRRLPDREPRADAEPAPHAAGLARRPHRAGRARAPGADPGRRGASLYREARAAPGRPGLRDPLRAPLARAGAGGDARRDRVPGPGAGGVDGARRLQPRRGGGPAPRDEPQALGRGDPRVPRPLHRGRDGARRRARGRRADLRAGARLLRLRLPEGARGRVRPARLPVDLAARALRAGVPVRAAERAADGLLSAGRAGARRAAARHGGAAAPHQPQRRRSAGSSSDDSPCGSGSATSRA